MILENATVQFFVGDLYTGAAPVFTGPGSAIIAQIKRLEASDELKKTNTSGASGYVANRFHSREAMCRLQGVVPATGTALRNAAGGSLVGYNCKIVYKPLGSLAAADTYIGVCTRWNPNSSQGDNQLLDIEIDCSADYVVVA